MIMVSASIFPSKSFGIPWSSGKNGKLTISVPSRLEGLPIVPACEIKLFSIWENALDGIISHHQRNSVNFIGKMKYNRHVEMVTYTQ